MPLKRSVGTGAQLGFTQFFEITGNLNDFPGRYKLATAFPVPGGNIIFSDNFH
jgi:hypothetical protein